MPDESLPRNAKDVIQKLLVSVHRDALLDWYGVDAPPIVDTRPTVLDTLEVQERLLDALFVTADGELLDVEFQGTYRAEDLLRFGEYALKLAAPYGQKVRVVVVYLGSLTSAPDRVEVGAVTVRVENVFLGARDAAAALEHLAAVAPGAWTVADDLTTAFLPFMRHAHLTPAALAGAAAALVRRAPREHQPYVAALVMGMTAAFLPPEVLDSLKEVMEMTAFLQELLEEGMAKKRAEAVAEGLAKGRAEGQNEMAVQAVLAFLASRFPHENLESVATGLAGLDADTLLRTVVPLAARASTLTEVVRTVERLDPSPP